MIYMSEIAKLSEAQDLFWGSIYVLRTQRYVITWTYTIVLDAACRGSNSTLERCVSLYSLISNF